MTDELKALRAQVENLAERQARTEAYFAELDHVLSVMGYAPLDPEKEGRRLDEELARVLARLDAGSFNGLHLNYIAQKAGVKDDAVDRHLKERSCRHDLRTRKRVVEALADIALQGEFPSEEIMRRSYR